MRKVQRIETLANGYRIGIFNNTIILCDKIGQQYGEFTTFDAARAQALHLMRAEAAAKGSLHSWDGR